MKKVLKILVLLVIVGAVGFGVVQATRSGDGDEAGIKLVAVESRSATSGSATRSVSASR
jgi:hypothetical protein